MITLKKVHDIESQTPIVEYRLYNNTEEKEIYFFWGKDIDLVKEIIKDKNLIILNSHNKDMDIRNLCSSILRYNDYDIQIED
jgi:general stress protein 26